MDMDMGSGSESMTSMQMYFSTELPVTVAFKGWDISTTGELIGSCFGIAGIAIIYEIMKKLRQYFLQVYTRKSPYATEPSKVSPSGLDTQATKDNGRPQYAYFWGMHLLNSLAFLIQVFVGYLLMLIVMVYNVWLVVSVVVGLALGYFVAYFIGAGLGLNEVEISEECPKSSIETIDMVITNKQAPGTVQETETHDADSEFHF